MILKMRMSNDKWPANWVKQFKQNVIVGIKNALAEKGLFRKSWYSINAMICAGASGRVYYVKSSSPGKDHDSPIFTSSPLFKKLSNDNWRPFEHSIMIADSAYCGTHSFLATPFCDETENRREQSYNRQFVRARVSIEQTIGRLKNRWTILMGKMRFKRMEDCGKIIQIACAINNFILSHEQNITFEDDLQPDPRLDALAGLPNFEHRNGRRRAVQTKEKILNVFY